MKEQTRIGLRIIVYTLTMIGASILIFIISMQAWTSHYSTVAYHSYLAFLAIAAAAWSYSRIRYCPSIHHILIFSVLIARSVIHLGAAIDHLFEQSPQILFETPTRISSDLLEILFLSVTFIIAALLQKRKPFGYTSKKFVFPIIIGILAIDGFVYHILFPILSDSQIQLFGLVFGFLAIASIILASFLWFRSFEDKREYESVWVLTSLIIFGAAILPLLYALINPTIIWGLSMNLQAAGFYTFALAVSKPIRIDIGMSEKAAFVVITSLSILIFIPFIIAISVVAWIPNYVLIDFGAYLMSHMGSAVLSSVMAFLLYRYCKHNPKWYFYPLILCLAIWAYADFHLILFFQPEVNLTNGESLVPYMVSSLFTIFNLILAIKWAIEPRELKLKKIEDWILPRFLFMIPFIFIGSILEAIILAEYSAIAGTPIGRSLLLSLNILIPFLIVNLGVITVRRTKSLESAEVIALAFLALRIIPNILKGNFDDWQAGWWAAEIILLAGSLIGPAIFGTLYLRSTIRAERERRRATLYSDLLVHDITNYHQAIQVALDLLEYNEMPVTMKKQAIEDAFLSLKRADHLIRNVRHLGQSEEIETVLTEPINLVTCIKQAFNEAYSVSSPEGVEFNIDASEDQYYVRANNLLVDVFLNLIRNAIQYSPNEKRIDIQIQKISQDETAFYETRVIDYGQGIDSEKKATLFQRYMKGASGTGLGLSVVYSLVQSYDGQIHVENRVEGDYTKGTVFVVTLPAVI